MLVSLRRLALVSMLLGGLFVLYRAVVERTLDTFARHPYDNIVERYCLPDWQSARRLELLGSDEVLSQLSIAPESLDTIKRLLDAYQKQSQQLWKEWEENYPDASYSRPREVEGLSALVMRTDQEIAKHLNASQQVRVNQLRRRRAGWIFVFEDEASARLLLTPEQERAVKDLLVENTLASTNYRREWQVADESKRQVLVQQREANEHELQARFHAVLTPAQRKIYSQLLGYAPGEDFTSEATSSR